MDGQRYFECNPWDRACSFLQEQEHGEVVQISAQGVYEKGSIHRHLQVWEKRVEELVGKKLRGNLIETDRAISFVGVYGENVLVRFFFDDGADNYSENFEIVTTKSLIIWKPNVINQGHMLSQEECFIESSQQYVVDLEALKC